MTSHFEVKGSQIYLKKSKAFPFVLVTLLLFRTVLKVFLGNSVDPGELAGMFFLLAFSMLVPWRLAMLYRYKKNQRPNCRIMSMLLTFAVSVLRGLFL